MLHGKEKESRWLRAFSSRISGAIKFDLYPFAHNRNEET